MPTQRPFRNAKPPVARRRTATKRAPLYGTGPSTRSCEAGASSKSPKYEKSNRGPSEGRSRPSRRTGGWMRPPGSFMCRSPVSTRRCGWRTGRSTAATSRRSGRWCGLSSPSTAITGSAAWKRDEPLRSRLCRRPQRPSPFRTPSPLARRRAALTRKRRKGSTLTPKPMTSWPRDQTLLSLPARGVDVARCRGPARPAPMNFHPSPGLGAPLKKAASSRRPLSNPDCATQQTSRSGAS